MKIRAKLDDEARERYGCPEWLEVDPVKVSMRETVAMQKGVDILGAICSYDNRGPWIDGLKAREPFAFVVLAWLGLRRAGITNIPLSEVDADRIEWDVETDPVDPGEPGKDESSPETTS